VGPCIPEYLCEVYPSLLIDVSSVLHACASAHRSALGPAASGLPFASPGARRRTRREVVLLTCIGTTVQAVGQDELFGPLPTITTTSRSGVVASLGSDSYVVYIADEDGRGAVCVVVVCVCVCVRGCVRVVCASCVCPCVSHA
jgi:hypothetical protein